MAKTATIHARMDEQIKNDAIRVFNELGISTADAITLFFRQVALKNGIPFELTADSKPINNEIASEDPITYISKYKQDDLEKVLSAIPDSVDELWVFGSAVTPYCRPESDLDVCIIGDKITKADRRILAHAPRRGMDLLDISHSEFEKERQDPNSIFYDVYNKGIRIYKKGD